MPTNLTLDEMKANVRLHFEDFVNNRKPEVISWDRPGPSLTDSVRQSPSVRCSRCSAPSARSSSKARARVAVGEPVAAAIGS